MEYHQPVAEYVMKPVFELTAEGDFRYKIKDISASVDGVQGHLHIYFSLAGSCHSVEQDRFAVMEGFLYL